MYNLVNLVNDVIDIFLRKGIGRLESADSCFVFKIGKYTLVIPEHMLKEECKKKVVGKFYSRPRKMSHKKILAVIDLILNEYMFTELSGVNYSIEKIRASLSKRGKPEEFREGPPGKVHTRFRRGKTKYVLVSDAPANSETNHELPLFHQLKERWTLGSVLRSFSLLREDKYGWHREFEIDAISIVENEVFLFEMKHNTYPDPNKIIKDHLRAARWIGSWHKKMNHKITHFCPVLYMRKKQGAASQVLNHIFFEELPEEFSSETVRFLKRYWLAY
ncbi:MAG: hypothetical protein GF411_00325 [Candidatus Lokiarchaeota archaeon]|nr:hypothetical protein [Candidatus Lokiarchaeota archaeon]